MVPLIVKTAVGWFKLQLLKDPTKAADIVNKAIRIEREKLGDKIVVLANLSKDYVQFTMPYDGDFHRYEDFKRKILSSSYQYDMKPWEFWILIK